MKWFILVCSFLVTIIGGFYIGEIRKTEIFVFDLYIRNFDGYIRIDDEGNMCLDYGLLKEKFIEYGYVISFDNKPFCFEVCFKNIFSWKKKYEFYLEKNDDLG